MDELLCTSRYRRDAVAIGLVSVASVALALAPASQHGWQTAAWIKDLGLSHTWARGLYAFGFAMLLCACLPVSWSAVAGRSSGRGWRLARVAIAFAASAMVAWTAFWCVGPHVPWLDKQVTKASQTWWNALELGWWRSALRIVIGCAGSLLLWVLILTSRAYRRRDRRIDWALLITAPVGPLARSGAALAANYQFLAHPWGMGAWDPRQKLVDRAKLLYELFDFATLLASPLPLVLAVLAVGLWRRAARANECPFCGYCLTGLTKSICPECGRDTTTAPPSRL